ncbi:MAG: hypothetical protein IKD53_11030 [Clostridia bacterium]|nr:hypothetical protein [Clostridia bacterium]MBR7189071.1 hypothetical protein [Clostridia bacterium]
MSKELALVQNTAAYLPSAQELAEVSAELKGVLRRSMLGTIQIANGGAGVFKVKEPGADEATGGITAVEGVILCSHPTNTYWGHDYANRADGEAPICRSMDGVNGTILETGEVRVCADCPFNQFTDGRKQCVNKRQLYIMRADDLVPILFSLPPTALKYFDQYLVRCRLTMRVPLFSVVTRITLKNVKSQNGNEYSIPVFEPVGKLPREEAARMRDYAQAFAEAAQRNGITVDDAEPQQEAAQAAPAYVQVPDEDLPF